MSDPEDPEVDGTVGVDSSGGIEITFTDDQWGEDVPPELLPPRTIHYHIFIFGTCLLLGYIVAIILASNGMPVEGILLGTIVASVAARIARSFAV